MSDMQPGTSEPVWVGDVLGFWFEETPAEARFKKDPAFDAAITERFGELYQRLAAEPPSHDNLTPRLALAAIIVLDQFPRNMFRDSPRAFATDPKALVLAKAAVAAGLDMQVNPVAARHFLYLPFEHSENMADQDRSLALISALGDAELTRYAVAHRDIIVRFGRYPHRNAALGRSSTFEEAAFLKEPGSSF